jgi:hypothetical protein
MFRAMFDGNVFEINLPGWPFWLPVGAALPAAAAEFLASSPGPRKPF